MLLVPVLLVPAVFVAAAFGAAASDLAALLSDVTAVSRALVAVPIAVSALVSTLAELDALVAAALSLPAAEETRVAAPLTVRGVTAALDEDRDAVVERPADGLPVAPADRLLAAREPTSLPDALRLEAGFAPVLLVLAAFWPVLFLAALVLPALVLPVLVLAVAVFAVPEVLVPAAEPARLGLAVRAEAVVVAALFVGGTDLPPIWIS